MLTCHNQLCPKEGAKKFENCLHFIYIYISNISINKICLLANTVQSVLLQHIGFYLFSAWYPLKRSYILKQTCSLVDSIY